MTFSCEKKTYDQYVKIFKENNPHILKSIMEHRNEVAAYSDGEKKEDRTQESNEDNNDDDNIDYNFCYENISNWNERIRAVAVRIVDTLTNTVVGVSAIRIVTVLVSPEN